MAGLKPALTPRSALIHRSRSIKGNPSIVLYEIGHRSASLRYATVSSFRQQRYWHYQLRPVYCPLAEQMLPAQKPNLSWTAVMIFARSALEIDGGTESSTWATKYSRPTVVLTTLVQ